MKKTVHFASMQTERLSVPSILDKLLPNVCKNIFTEQR